MELKEIAVVSGKPGLYKIIKPAVNGVILEAMDGSKARFIVGTSTKVSVLGEISVYTEDGENIPLVEVFRTIYSKNGKNLNADPKQSDQDLRNFFTELVPAHDKQRVYISDIKKIVTWFTILVNNGFDKIFENKAETKREEITSQPADVNSEVKKDKKSVKKETSPEAEVQLKEDTIETAPSSKKNLKEQEGSEKTAGMDPTPKKPKAAKKAEK